MSHFTNTKTTALLKRFLDNSYGMDDCPEECCYKGKLLVAMPYVPSDRFQQAVIYICDHDEYGALGFFINKNLPDISFIELLEQLNINHHPHLIDHKVSMHYGGPFEISRGFVIHSPEYQSNNTINIHEGFSVTATIDILRSVCHGQGPRNFLLALGYVGWEPGELETEMLNNYWLVVDAQEDIIFGSKLDSKWESAMGCIGVNPYAISYNMGHA